jgi:hypothetical protein
MRDVLHPDCELVIPGSMRPTRRDQAGQGGRRCSCSYWYYHRYHAPLVTPLAGSREPRKARLESGPSSSRGDWI